MVAGVYVDVEAADNSGKIHTTLSKESIFIQLQIVEEQPLATVAVLVP